MFNKAIDLISLAAVAFALTLAVASMAHLFAYLDFRDCIDHIDAVTDGAIAAQVYQCQAATSIDTATVERFLP